MSTATTGRRREYLVRDDLASHAWVPVMRAAGSHGVADLLMAHPNHGAALVQVGSRSKTLGPDDRQRFTHVANLCGALALLAVVIPRKGITYWQINTGLPASWARWAP